MPKTKNSYNVEDVQAVASWKDLQEVVDLEHVKLALIGRETQRLAHKKYSLRKQLILEKAKAAGITAD